MQWKPTSWGPLAVIAAVGVWLAPTETPANLVANWRFNGDLSDSSGFGHTATFNGGTPSYVGASAGQAIVLDGVDDFLSVAASGNNLDFNGNSFAIAAWLTVHTAQTARRDSLIAGKADFSNLGNYALTVDYLNQTDDVENILTYGYTRRTSGANASVPSVLYFDANEVEVNLVFSFNAVTKTIDIYRNGSLRDTLTAADITGPISTASDFTMGKGLFTDFLRADLDEIQVYDQPLDQSQVTSLFNGGNGPAAIPEPSVMALLAGAGMLYLSRRR
jgi:hypothetical protein